MKTYIIPLFIPHFGCPHTCVFCSQQKITGCETSVTPAEIRKTIEGHLQQITRPYYIEAAFYGGSFTALTSSVQCELLAPAYEYIKAGKINALRISTRPDAIDLSTLRVLKAYGVKTIELGAQSFDDQVLHQSARGHTAADIERAATLIRQEGFTLGIQLMPGLPGDELQSILHSLQETIRLQPDIVRIYPTVVIGGTSLEKLYRQGRYEPLSLAQAVRYGALMKLYLEREQIRVIRLGLQASETLDDGATVIAGPYHPAFGEMADAYLFYLMVGRILDEVNADGEVVRIHHAPRDASRVRGNKNSNKEQWRQAYQLRQIQFIADLAYEGSVDVEIRGRRYRMNYSLLKCI